MQHSSITGIFQHRPFTRVELQNVFHDELQRQRRSLVVEQFPRRQLAKGIVIRRKQRVCYLAVSPEIREKGQQLREILELRNVHVGLKKAANCIHLRIT